jgi:hypothetical protein
MHLLFTNTGVQLVCIPLNAARRYTTAQIGYGWQYCRVQSSASQQSNAAPTIRNVSYIQWQIIQGPISRLFLAIDTSLGDPALGHVCSADALAGDYQVKLEGLVDITGELLPGIPHVELCFRAAASTAGDARPVDLVVDFGNSRSGALVLETSLDGAESVKMMPFELLDRYRLDGWDERGEQRSHPETQWFSSKTRWCDTPYLAPEPVVRTEFVQQTVRSLFCKKQSVSQRHQHVEPDLFEDLSLARIGHEADDLGQQIHVQGELRLGVSSPKRYLWADDDAWLEGAFWHMADPYDRRRSGAYATKLEGRLLGLLDVAAHEAQAERPLAMPTEPEIAPLKPRYPPRTLMAAALYEFLCQAFCFVNSLRYRLRAGDAARAREIRSLTLTYPSGMFQEERACWRTQAEQAIRAFRQTLGKHQLRTPSLDFGIDEASAVHLAYLWSEVQLVGQDPRLWFDLMGRGENHEGTVTDTPDREVRIACIDIGGGTSNIMIASYQCRAGIDDAVAGRVLHRDSVASAGDHLVKRLLERVIVPAFAEALGLEPADVLLLFGPDVPQNRGFRAQRVEWMNRLFVPLAEAYLRCSVDDDVKRAISHTDPAIVDPAVLESLATVCNRTRGPGYYNLWQDLGLKYDAARFTPVVHEVFDELLFDYCRRIVDHGADVVLLAGQPTKLETLRAIIRRYLPLPESRIIAMHQHYAGSWYPYQDPTGRAPGRIVDPKSAVVVGAAIQLLVSNGLLPQFRFGIEGLEREATYHWGVMTESTAQLRPERILFRPAKDELRTDSIEFKTGSQRLLIGRTPSDDPRTHAMPVYQLKLTGDQRIGRTEVSVRLRRIRANNELEEHLVLDSVTGLVAGEPAVLGQNVHFRWRTLADERFFLDTGALDHLAQGEHL